MSSKKNKLLESAQKNIQKGQYDRAISEYEEIVRLDTVDVRHRQRLAELLTKADRKDEAVKEYHSLAKHYVDNIHYLKAIAVYKQIQKLEPANAETSLTLASLNEKQGLIGNAAAEYTLAIQIYENNSENIKALKVLESMLALDPQNLAIRLRIAEKYFSTGNEDKSFAEFLSLAHTLKELNDENGLNHVIERTTRNFPQRVATLLAALADKEGETAVVTAVAPPAAVTPPIDTLQNVTVAVAGIAVPVKKETAVAIPPAELLADTDFELPDELFVPELAEDDLLDDILPIEELEDEQEVDIEIPPDDFDWEEEININELESGPLEASVPATEIEEPQPGELAVEEIHELEEIDLELEPELEIEPESFELAAEEVPEVNPETADSAVDLARELALFADEIDFDLMNIDNTGETGSFDAFSSYTIGDLDHEDSESHYSLGLAYREMSLFEDAISEFTVASRSPERKIDCLILQGLCHRENGEVNAAITLLSQTLQEPGLTDNQLVSISYELALCHEEVGELPEARRLYSKIVTLRPDFSEAVARLTKIKG